MTKAQAELTLYTDTQPIHVLHNPLQSLLDALDKAQSQLNAGDRGGAYLTLYRELGNEQLLIQAQITTYSGIWGSGALIGNAWAKQEAGGRYNITLDQFSKDIAQGTINAIRADIRRGGSGHLTDAQFQEADRGVWKSKGMGNLFPGNIQFMNFIFGDHAVNEGVNAVVSRGSWNAIGIGARHMVPIDGYMAKLVGSSRDGRDVASLVGKRPSEFANNPRYKTSKASSGRFILVIDQQTGYVEVIFDIVLMSFPPLIRNFAQLPDIALDKDSLAYIQRLNFYKYLGANLHSGVPQ